MRVNDEDEVEDEELPRASLAEALAWLEARGPVERAGQGASAGSIVALRYRLGRVLPAGLERFLREHHWIDTGLVATLAVEGEERTTIEAARRAIAAHVEATWRSLPAVDDTARASGEALLAWIPVAELGNPLPFGSALLLDESGALRCASVREFAFTAVADEEAEHDFEAALVNALADWHEG